MDHDGHMHRGGSRDAYASQNWYVRRLHIFIGCNLFVGQLVSEARKGKKRDCPEVIYMWRVTH